MDPRIEALAAEALNRMDTKGETAWEAAENVTGGNREDMAAIVASLRGESCPAQTFPTDF